LPGSSSSSSTVSTPLSAGLSSTSTSTPSKGRHRLATEPCTATRDSNEDLPKLATPKSPRTPTIGPAVMVHAINHRFTMTFKMLTVCDLCMKQMFIGMSLILVLNMTFKNMC
jgi:kinase suppressor of Ras 2